MNSKFRKANREKIGGYIDQLIAHSTGLDKNDENYTIAQRFIWQKLDNNNFPDTDEHQVKRQMEKLNEKLILHSQDERANRLKYLVSEFKKRKTFDQVGVSDTHMCILQLLMLLSINPTGAGTLDDFSLPNHFSHHDIGGVHDTIPQSTHYLSQKDVDRINQEQFECQMKEIENCEEYREIKRVKRQWEREIEDDQESWSSLSEYEMGDVEENVEMEGQEEEVQEEIRKKEVKMKGIQTVFGGLPGKENLKLPKIEGLKFNKRKEVKKFQLNEFLDQYLQDTKDEEPKQQEQTQLFNLDLDHRENQYELKNLLKIRTFDEIQLDLSKRLQGSQNPFLVNQGRSKLFPNRSSMTEPNNLNRDLNVALNPFNLENNDKMRTERNLVQDTLKVLSGLESDTFMRDPNQLYVLFKLRHDKAGFCNQVQLSHLSQGTVRSSLNKFLHMANEMQKTMFLFRGIQMNSEKLSTVIQSLIFVTNKILDRFNTEINDLQQIFLLQAGQISKSQLNLGPQTFSRVGQAYPNYEQEPLTLLKLGHLLDSLFSKISTLLDIIEKGILDFVAFNHNHGQKIKLKLQLEPFLHLADFKLDESTYQKLVAGLCNSFNLPSAKLNLEFIKPADRATYLLNYLYMQIQSDQLLVDNRIGNERLDSFKECFLVCLKPYLQILNDWVCKGDDDLSTHDLKNEFFIKANHRLFVGMQSEDEQQQNSRKQWSESYVFRTINISQLLGQAMGDIDNMLQEEDVGNNRQRKQQIEISCPIFLRPLMKQILSVGKTIKIVRYLEENNQIQQTNKKKNVGMQQQLERMENVVAQKAPSLDHQGLDYDKLSRQNVRIMRCEKQKGSIDFANLNRDMPSFEIEQIANNLITETNNPTETNENLQYQIESLKQAPFQWGYQTEWKQDGEDALMSGRQSLTSNAQMSGCTEVEQDPNNKQLMGLFKMPCTIRSIDANQFNQSYHQEIQNNLQNEMVQFNQQKALNDKYENCSTNENSPKEVKMIDNNMVFGNKKCSAELVIGQGLQKIKSLEANHFFNFAQQELSIYSSSMRMYQCSQAFNYYLNSNLADSSKIIFKDLTIENYIFETVMMPIMQIFRQTSDQFLNQYLMRDGPQFCQLQDQLSLLHKVYFLQGVSMHKFLANLFDNLDQGSGMTNQLYLVNGNFQECLSEILDKVLPNLNKIQIMTNMNVNFEKNLGKLLQGILIGYDCEWPIEIVVDKQTIQKNYNKVFRLLVKIKYAKYLMEKRDYHIKQPNLLKKTNSYTYARKNYQQEIDEMGARDRLLLEHQIMLGQLIFQLQLFQRELLHFITTLDDYFMTRATSMETDKFLQELQKCKVGTPIKDLDDIIEMHDNSMNRIMQLCLLDTKSTDLLRYMLEIVEICQEFRNLIKEYVQNKGYDEDQESEINDSFESMTRGQRIESKFQGMGQLIFTNSNFAQVFQEVEEKLNKLREQYEKHMMVLTTMLNKLTKTQSGKIILNYLLEILQRLNFNSYYISREDENLPPIGYFN